MPSPYCLVPFHMSSVIQLTNVTKTYTMGDTTFNALDDVTLAIQKGDFAAITGPSGSGKSTLMHIIGILDRPTIWQSNIG
jgi:putative ABC transport system ATP-binding protein